MAEHELMYRAGTAGLEHFGIGNNPTPFWYCTCGGWTKARDALGRPFREAAEVQLRIHVSQVQRAEIIPQGGADDE